MTTFEEFVERSSWSPGTFVKDIVRWHREESPKKNHVFLEDTMRILERHGYVVDADYKIQDSPLSTFIKSWVFPAGRDSVSMSVPIYDYTEYLGKRVRVDRGALKKFLVDRGFVVSDFQVHNSK